MFKFKLFIIVCFLLIVGCSNKESINNIEKEQEEPIINGCSTIGEECAGGFLAHIDDEGGRLIAAPASSEQLSQWGCRGQKMNITKEEYGAGMENTKNIITWHIGWEDPWFTGPSDGYCHEKNDGTIAANYCDQLVENNYDDWFLPSKEELHLLYENLSRKENTGFEKIIYWSSSEFSDGSAWVKSLEGGQEYGYQKTFEQTIRCVRYTK